MKLTLKVVRVIIAEQSIEEVAEYCGITAEELEAYEKDSGEVPSSVAKRLSEVFNWPLDLIYWGSGKEVEKQDRALTKLLESEGLLLSNF